LASFHFLSRHFRAHLVLPDTWKKAVTPLTCDHFPPGNVWENRVRGGGKYRYVETPLTRSECASFAFLDDPGEGAATRNPWHFGPAEERKQHPKTFCRHVSGAVEEKKQIKSMHARPNANDSTDSRHKSHPTPYELSNFHRPG
jgi:hypothetical protein